MVRSHTPKPWLSVEDYLASERETRLKHEYVNGVVYAMGGASDRHGLIALNLGGYLNAQLPDQCQVFTSDMKVHIRTQADEIFYYPDVLVSCDKDDRNTYFRDKPTLIAEVLSPSTDRTDRFEKLNAYAQVPSLQEYLLISQDYPQVTLHRRAHAWEPRVIREGDIELTSVELTISVDSIYRRVEF